jgi:putative phage-type endonuclease
MTTATDLAPVTALTGVPVPGVEPGSVEWLKTMSASKVAAALGLSPYESPFSLWHRMAGRIVDAQPPEPQLLRGHYLEDGVRRWFLDQHPDWQLQTAGSYAHPDQPRYTASPDGTLLLPTGELRGYEGKTAADDDEWGVPGTDEIPAGYRVQVLWQMFVTGTRITHVAVLSAYLDLREYIVTYDDTEAAFIVAKAQEFLDTLPGAPAEQRPSIDTHTATYEAIRRLHPLIDGSDVDLDPETAALYCHARHALKAAEQAEAYAKSVVADELGMGRRARFNGQTLAYRQAKGEDGVPYLTSSRNLPTFTETDQS